MTLKLLPHSAHGYLVYGLLVDMPLVAFLMVGCVQRERSITVGEIPFGLTLWVSDRCPRYGETVTIRETVTNRDSNLHVIELKDRPVLDLYAGYRTANETLIRWSDGKTLTSELTRLALGPGEAKSIEMPLTIPAGACCGGASVTFYYDERSLNNPMTTSLSITPNDCFR